MSDLVEMAKLLRTHGGRPNALRVEPQLMGKAALMLDEAAARITELEAENARRQLEYSMKFHDMAVELAEKDDELDRLEAEAKRMNEEIEFLRSYGNKDCTWMADAVLAEKRAEKAAPPTKAAQEWTAPEMASFHAPVITPRMHVPIEEV